MKLLKLLEISFWLAPYQFYYRFCCQPSSKWWQYVQSIKIVTTEFAGGSSAGKRFYLKCRYLKTDERIEKKVSKVRRNSSVMIVGELTLINSEFNVEIQDLNFLPTSIANIESSATSSSSAFSLYSWPATLSSRISAQEMTNTLAPENLAKLWMQ